MNKKTQTQKLEKEILKQARSGDTVCSEYFYLQNKNLRSKGGYQFIEIMLDMQDEFDDDFRPY